MSRKRVNEICAELPGAEVSDPWGGGHDAWKVGGKMFAVVGGMDLGVSIKTPDAESAALLIEARVAQRAAYLHRSWVLVPWGAMDDAELRERIRMSYRLIREALPKKAQAGLGPLPD